MTATNRGKRDIQGLAYRKFQAIQKAHRIYLDHPGGISDKQVAILLDVNERTVSNIRVELGAKRVRVARYTLAPSDDDIALAKAILRRARIEKQNNESPAGESE